MFLLQTQQTVNNCISVPQPTPVRNPIIAQDSKQLFPAIAFRPEVTVYYASSNKSKNTSFMWKAYLGHPNDMTDNSASCWRHVVAKDKVWLPGMCNMSLGFCIEDTWVIYVKWILCFYIPVTFLWASVKKEMLKNQNTKDHNETWTYRTRQNETGWYRTRQNEAERDKTR